MQTSKIYDLLERAVLSLRLDGITRDDVKRPNVEFCADGKPLFFELYVGDDAPRIDTETSAVSRRVASIVIVGELGEGTERLERIARGIVDIFATYNPRRFKGFSDIERVFSSSQLNGGGRVAARSNVYVEGVRATAPGIFDGRVKVTVFIDLEVQTRVLDA